MDFEEESEAMVLDDGQSSAPDAVQRGQPAVPPPGDMMATGPASFKRGIDHDTDGHVAEMPPLKKARSSPTNEGSFVVNQAPAPTCSGWAYGVPRVGSVCCLCAMPAYDDARESFGKLLANYMLRLPEEDRLEFQEHIEVCNNDIFQCFTHFSTRRA